MSEPLIRVAEERDLEAIRQIVNGEILEGVAHFATEPLDPRQILADWRDTCRRYPWLVGEIDQEVVCFAKAYPWKPRGAYQWSVEIGVYVRPEHQGKGIGKLLYEHLFPALEDAGFRTVVAGIVPPNEPSVRLHERFGMKYIGTLPAIGWKNGAWRDVGYWIRRLGDDPDAPPKLL